jgi:hypothetical protein
MARGMWMWLVHDVAHGVRSLDLDLDSTHNTAIRNPIAIAIAGVKVKELQRRAFYTTRAALTIYAARFALASARVPHVGGVDDVEGQ